MNLIHLAADCLIYIVITYKVNIALKVSQQFNIFNVSYQLAHAPSSGDVCAQ
nr:MAG TPA: hypothetical protein [Caudoviricetes sp.]